MNILTTPHDTKLPAREDPTVQSNSVSESGPNSRSSEGTIPDDMNEDHHIVFEYHPSAVEFQQVHREAFERWLKDNNRQIVLRRGSTGRFTEPYELFITRAVVRNDFPKIPGTRSNGSVPGAYVCVRCSDEDLDSKEEWVDLRYRLPESGVESEWLERVESKVRSEAKSSQRRVRKRRRAETKNSQSEGHWNLAEGDTFEKRDERIRKRRALKESYDHGIQSFSLEYSNSRIQRFDT